MTTTPQAQRSTVAYLTGVSTELTRSAARSDLGLLVTPLNSTHRQAHHYELVGADNGVFGLSRRGKAFDPQHWLRWLELLDPARTTFVTLPDVLHFVDGRPVGELGPTVELAAQYVDTVRALGFAPAIVAQDGLRSLDELPFAVDAVFVGGSDGYKLGPDAAALVAQARARGLWTHLGRVNSYKRLAYAQAIGCDSADGTYIGFGPSTNGPKVLGWLDRIAHENALELAA